MDVLAILAAFVFALIGFAKSVRNQEWNAVLTTVAWWVAGILAVFVFAATVWANKVVLVGIHLDAAGFFDKIVIGIIPGSFGITLNQGLKAIDNSQSAAQPPLISSSPGQGAPEEIPAPFTGEVVDPDVAEAGGSFVINADGSVEFSNVTARGSIED